MSDEREEIEIDGEYKDVLLEAYESFQEREQIVRQQYEAAMASIEAEVTGAAKCVRELHGDIPENYEFFVEDGKVGFREPDPSEQRGMVPGGAQARPEPAVDRRRKPESEEAENETNGE